MFETHLSPLSRRTLLRTSGLAMLGVAASSALVACGGNDDKTGNQSSSPASAQGQPKTGGTLLVGAGGSSSTDTLDPHNAVNTISIAAVAQFAETLLRYDEHFKIQPHLATSVEPNADATLWTIKLRTGVKFHDGKPMTADDVKYTFEKILDKKSPGAAASQLSTLQLDKVEVVDDHTLKVPFSAPFAMFRDSLAIAATSAVRVVPRGFDVSKPIGTGPFKYDSFTPAQLARFVKNDAYWMSGQPYLDAVEIHAINDDGARVNALIAGQMHAITSVSAGSVAALKAQPNVQLLISESGSWNPIVMRTDKAPFDNPKVREAFKLIADRSALINSALAGQGQVANDLYGRYDPAYNTKLAQRARDIDKAKSLLAEAGQSGLKVQMVTSKIAEGVVPAAQVLVQQASEAGVTIDLLEVQPTDFWSKQFLQATLTQSNWATRNYLQQAADSMVPNAPYNETHWSNKDWLALVQKAMGTADDTARGQLIAQAQEIEWNDGGYINWGWYDTVDGLSNKVHGLVPDASGISLNTFSLGKVWIEA